MGTGLFITGTDTGVGKTAVTAGLLAAYRKAGLQAIGLKPVQSGALKCKKGLISADAAFYLKAAGIDDDWSRYNLYCFEHPLSPHLAAELSGITINPGAILTWCRDLLDKHDMVLVEGAGGICVPLNRSGYTMASLARDLGFPIVVVSRPSLGTINHTVLTVKHAQALGLEVKGFVFNGSGIADRPAENDNARIIETLAGVPLLGMLPCLDDLDVDRSLPGSLTEAVAACLKWKEIGGIS